MKLREYEKLVKTEAAAREYFLSQCERSADSGCPRCGETEGYSMKDGRSRCVSCRCTYHAFSGRWINRVKIPCRQWVRIVKLFELDVSARKIGTETELSYPTALKAVDTIRYALMASTQAGKDLLLSGEIEMDESYFGGRRKGKRGRGAAGKVPVFGILERNGIVCVEPVKDVTAETLLTLAVKKVRRGSIVYTDKLGSYDALMCCGYRHLRVDHARRFSQGRVSINGLEGFWSYAKERLMKHHGVSKRKFPLYLKEMEFRYNHRKEPSIFGLITENLCRFGPNLL